MELSILITTYNSAEFLLKNLELLSQYIRKGELSKFVEIVVSNNKSTDDTDEKIPSFKEENDDINIRYFLQNKNLGLEKNALFVLKEAKGEYVMYLGDDDYIEYGYLINSLKIIEDNSQEIGCIVTSWQAIDTKGKEIEHRGRDINVKSSIHKKGLNCVKKMMWRGHQLSGLVLRREGLYSNYIDNCISNIYPFMYFVGLSCLRNNCYHLTSNPVKVTVVNQNKKDWGYGKDGLIIDRMKNVYSLFKAQYKKRILTEKAMNLHQNRRFNKKYLEAGLKKFLLYLFRILTTKYITFLGKIHLLKPLPKMILSKMYRNIVPKSS